MKAFHDSRDVTYRKPCGALQAGSSVTLALEVHEETPAAVKLRTWTEGEGERLYPMKPGKKQPNRFKAKLTPEKPGVIWYQFVILDDNGAELRYGALDGRTGGMGALRAWEPPSFKLTCYESGNDDEIAVNLQGRSLTAALVQYTRGETDAAGFAEAIESMREDIPAEAFARLNADLFNMSPRQLHERLAEGNLNDPKGRLWCATLVQKLLPANAGLNNAPRNYEAEGAFDQDCVAITENVDDLVATLGECSGMSTPFITQGSTFGFWRAVDDGTSICVLVNPAPYGQDVTVPLVAETATELIDGYHVSIADGAEGPEVHAHVRPWSAALLHFHPKKRLQQPMEPGLGVLAHITSLPADTYPGTLGAPATAFIDWLAEQGMRYWQVLPVNPTDEHGSPYSGTSVFAGNVRLLEQEAPSKSSASGYRAFCKREADWLEPYAAFTAIRSIVGEGAAWQSWPKKYRHYDPQIIEDDSKLRKAAEQCRKQQFAFDRQWKAMHAYARKRGVQIIGDMPIYVSADSADVWANPEIFQLNKRGLPATVAGCPPDDFAVDGQVWGNPIYDWDTLKENGYSWWLRRLKRAFELYDVVRLDHFIGFMRYYSIPAGETALAGSYHRGPGADFFRKAHDAFGPLPLIAEDLGLITPSVRALSSMCGFPGMDIVQFVDGNDPLSGYNPRPEKIAYTGTHDNQTLVGYCANRYPHLDAHQTAAEIMSAVKRCDADVRIFPLQDILGLGDEARMNTPGTTGINWNWQADHL